MPDYALPDFKGSNLWLTVLGQTLMVNATNMSEKVQLTILCDTRITHYCNISQRLVGPVIRSAVSRCWSQIIFSETFSKKTGTTLPF